jgi:hypothetical protein
LLGTLAVALSMDVAAGQRAPSRHASPGFHWPETLADIQTADKLPVEPLAAFLDELRPKDAPPLRIGEFRFAPMGDPSICLAATVDSSGRQIYFSVAVVCPDLRTTGSFQMTILPSAPPHLLGAELADLDGDGALDLLAKELAGGYQDSQTLPIYWYSVFRVKNSVPRDVSADHQKFYGQRSLLPWLEFFSSLLGPADSKPNGMAVEAPAEASFLRAKYDRRIAGKLRAGFEDALEWGNSDDPRLQMLAVETFIDIATPDATAELRKLGKARDRAVSEAATAGLRARAEPRP